MGDKWIVIPQKKIARSVEELEEDMILEQVKYYPTLALVNYLVLSQRVVATDNLQAILFLKMGQE